jgi:hypothetical protein
MINRFKRGLKAEEAALIATDLVKYYTIKRAEKSLNDAEEHVREAESDLNNEYKDWTHHSLCLDDVDQHDYDVANLQDAKLIYEALLDEVGVACHWYDYLTGDFELYTEQRIAQPSAETDLEIHEISRMAPDDEYSFTPIPVQTTITKVSLAKWFYTHLPDKAVLFDPTGSYKTIKTGYSIANIQVKQSLDVLTKNIESEFNFSEKITNTAVWQDLHKNTEKAVETFPSWRQTQLKPQKIPMNHIDTWLTDTLKITKREAETIKKIITEIFNL